MMSPFLANAELRVVASIKPIHSLVAAIMKDVGQPELILDGAGSPHSHNLKPSKARLLAKANIIFWIGPGLESFLKKPISTIGANARSIRLGDIDGLIKLNIRDADDFKLPTLVEGVAHDHGRQDPHIWLDPKNAIVMARAIRGALAKHDPGNAELYISNSKTLVAMLNSLTEETLARLETVRSQPFITHHDGYQYFERRFSLTSKGVLLVNPEILPGARHILEIAKTLKKLDKICVFTEPQLSQLLINTAARNPNIKIAQLDPLGIDIKNGPDLYFELIRTMAKSFSDCLSATMN